MYTNFLTHSGNSTDRIHPLQETSESKSIEGKKTPPVIRKVPRITEPRTSLLTDAVVPTNAPISKPTKRATALFEEVVTPIEKQTDLASRVVLSMPTSMKVDTPIITEVVTPISIEKQTDLASRVVLSMPTSMKVDTPIITEVVTPIAVQPIDEQVATKFPLETVSGEFTHDSKKKDATKLQEMNDFTGTKLSQKNSCGSKHVYDDPMEVYFSCIMYRCLFIKKSLL